MHKISKLPGVIPPRCQRQRGDSSVHLCLWQTPHPLASFWLRVWLSVQCMWRASALWPNVHVVVRVTWWSERWSSRVWLRTLVTDTTQKTGVVMIFAKADVIIVLLSMNYFSISLCRRNVSRCVDRQADPGSRTPRQGQRHPSHWRKS